MKYSDLPIGEQAPDVFNVVVEIPKGSANKYEYDPQLEVFKLDRTLYSPMHYPGDYGFVPSTIAADGDPVDVLVLVESATFPGCVIEARAVGMLEMVDQGVEDLKLLCVSTKDPRQETVKNYSDVHPHRLREIEHFFGIYKELEGKETETRGWRSAEDARRILVTASERFRKDGSVMRET
ncbi:MAG TPA: inorganic diphosphatase [Blastocatellia bacterium]|nr:inorganic diphosphatase [Blastocatellia bacterium]